MALAATAAALAGIAARADGAVKTYAGTGGLWSAGPWSPAGDPGKGDAVTLTSAGAAAVVVTYDPASLTLGTLALEDGGTGSMTLAQSANTLAVTGLESVGRLGTATFDLSGGTDSTTSLELAIDTGSSGTYALNGGTLTTQSVSGGAGVSTFNFNGGALQASAANTAFVTGLTSANVQAGGAVFDTNGYAVTVASPLIHDTTPGAAAIDGGLTVNGTGTLTLSAANTYTGTTTINAGTLNLANASALQNSTVNLSSTGGTLTFDQSVTGNAFTVGGLSGNGTLALHTNAATPAPVALTVGGNNASTTFSGVIGDIGSLIKNGTGALTLTGANTFSGNLNLNDGTVNVTGNGQLNANIDFANNFPLATYTVGAGATLNVNAGTGDPSVISVSAATLAVDGGTSANPATVNLSGNGSIAANVVLGSTGGSNNVINQSGGVLYCYNELNIGAVAGSSGTYNMTGGTLAEGFYGIEIGTGGTGTFVQSGGLVTESVEQNISVIEIGGGSGTGTYTLSGTAVAQAAYVQFFGTGVINLDGGLLNTQYIINYNTTGATLNFNGGTLQFSDPYASTYDVTLNVQAGGAVIDTQNYNLYLASALLHDTAAGTDGGLTKLGIGSLTLSGANTYTGPNTVEAGTLVLQGNASSSAADVQSGATLEYQGVTLTPGFSSLTAEAGGTIVFMGNTTGSGATAVTVPTSVTGGYLDGAGTYTIGAGGATFTATTIENGVAVGVTDGSATFKNLTSAGAVNVASGQTLTWTGGSNALGTLTVDGTADVSHWTSTGVITVDPTGTLSNSATNLILGGGSRTYVGSSAAPGGTLSSTGGTIELNGGLLDNNGTVTGTLDVNYGSEAMGAGTYGTVNVFQGGTFHPGNSPGTAHVTDYTFGPGSALEFDIENADGIHGTNWSLVDSSGAVDITASDSPNGKAVIDLDSLASTDSPGELPNFDPTQTYLFDFVDGTTIDGFNAADFTVNTSGFANALDGGSFSVVQIGNNLDLQFTPAAGVPEPTAFILFAAASMLTMPRLRRRCS